MTLHVLVSEFSLLMLTKKTEVKYQEEKIDDNKDTSLSKSTPKIKISLNC